MRDFKNSFYSIMTNRSEMVLGSPVMERLSKAQVIIFGVGGVGSWCAESLVRTGITRIAIVDSDIICPTNINRQIQATSCTIGESKVRELQKRLLEINPGVNISATHAVYDESTSASFDLFSFDYVIDAIDSINSKVHLIEKCILSKVKIYSSMGAGSKSEPSKIKTGLLSGTTNCPLAREVRRNLRKRNVTTDIMCVYSEEPPAVPAIDSICCTEDAKSVDRRSGKKRINGSLVHITAIFGFMLAGLVVNDIKNSID